MTTVYEQICYFMGLILQINISIKRVQNYYNFIIIFPVHLYKVKVRLNVYKKNTKNDRLNNVFRHHMIDVYKTKSI